MRRASRSTRGSVVSAGFWAGMGMEGSFDTAERTESGWWVRARCSSASSISGSSRQASTRRTWRRTVEAWHPLARASARIGMPAWVWAR